MTPRLSIVIVNWNAGAQLRACVDSIFEHGSPWVDRIVVVDNGSTDGSALSVDGLAKVTLIRAGQNLGFAKACNMGAAPCKSEFLLFLNPDAYLYPGSLSKSLAFMGEPRNSRVGICGIQLIDEPGNVARSCARFPSVIGLLAHAVGIDRLFPRAGYFMREWDHQNTRRVDHVIGAFFLVRSQVFDALHGFDERFFVYLEDLDFSLRAKRAGWLSVYLADAQAFHAGGGTSKQVKARRLFYSLRSRLVYSFKHFRLLGASVVLLATLFAEPVSRTALALIRRSSSLLKETWAAYGMLWRWLPAWAFKGATH